MVYGNVTTVNIIIILASQWHHEIEISLFKNFFCEIQLSELI